MSDVESVEATVPAESEAAVEEPTQQPEVTGEETTKAEPDESPSGEDPAEQPKRNWATDRIKQLSDKVKDAQRQTAEALERAQMMEAQQTQQQQPDFPKLEQFDYDEGAFQAAVAQYNAAMTQRTVQTAMSAQQRATAQQLQQNAQRLSLETFSERAAQFQAEHPDFQQVVSNRSVRMNDTVAQAVVVAPEGPAVAYHLGKNPAVAAELSALPPTLALVRFGMLAQQLSAPVSPITTDAPTPSKSPVGSNATVTKDPEKMTPEEYSKWRGYS